MEEDLEKKEVAEEVPPTEAQEKERIAQDKYLRLFAEFENYRTRSAKEQLGTHKHGQWQTFGKALRS